MSVFRAGLVQYVPELVGKKVGGRVWKEQIKKAIEALVAERKKREKEKKHV